MTEEQTIQHPLRVGVTVAFRRGSLNYLGQIEASDRMTGSETNLYRVRVLARSGGEGAWAFDIHEGQVLRVHSSEVI